MPAIARKWRIVAAVLSLLAAGLAIWLMRSAPDRSPAASELPSTGRAMLTGMLDAGGFPDPDTVPPDLPSDLLMKPEQRAEYWLFAGMLDAEDGSRWGFALAVGRIALSAQASERASAWAARDVFVARWSLTGGDGSEIVGQRIARGALGLAGATADPPAVRIADWRVGLDGESLRLVASEGQAGLELRLTLPAHRPEEVIGTGHRGFWYPRLRASGQVTRDGARIAVTGRVLFDRLWGRTLPTGQGQLGLNRHWLVLGDGTALRCQQLRRVRGGGLPLTECTLHTADRPTRRLTYEQVMLEPHDLARNPLHWRLHIPDASVALEIRPFGSSSTIAGTAALWPYSRIVAGDDFWGLLELGNFAGGYHDHAR